MDKPEKLEQSADYPLLLSNLVNRLKYRPGWEFQLLHLDRGQGSIGLTFDIITCTVNSYHHEQTNYRVHHYMPVPPAAYDERSWRRWLLEQLFLVERHEACEFFTIDGQHPYAPNHGPGNDPYIVFEHSTEEESKTSFRGKVKL